MKASFKLFPILAVLTIALMNAGCSTTGGYLGHAIVTEVQLNQANFEIVKSVSGEAQADYFLGIGPEVQDIVGQAKRAMIVSAQLKGSQAIINVTSEIKTTCFLIFWSQKKAYVSGEVVQFNK